MESITQTDVQYARGLLATKGVKAMYQYFLDKGYKYPKLALRIKGARPKLFSTHQ